MKIQTELRLTLPAKPVSRRRARRVFAEMRATLEKVLAPRGGSVRK